jgi:hypothetical protein
VHDALQANTRGVRAVTVSLVVLTMTAAVLVTVVAISGSSALLADTIHTSPTPHCLSRGRRSSPTGVPLPATTPTAAAAGKISPSRLCHERTMPYQFTR